MSTELTYYIILLLVYMGCNSMMVLGLNLQFGMAAIINFSYYILVAVGGYAAGLTVLGCPSRRRVAAPSICSASRCPGLSLCSWQERPAPSRRCW